MTGIGPEVVLLVAPLILLEVGLLVAALWDLTRPTRRVRGDSKLVWALVIVLVNTFGPIIYFVAGREEAAPAGDGPGSPTPPAPGARPGWVAPRGPTDPAGPSPATVAAPAAPAAPAPAARPPAAQGPAAPAVPTPAGVDPFALSGAPSVPVAPGSRARPIAPGERAISARGLTKRFGTGPSSVLALDRLDLDVPAGSVFGLLGPNGAGKTTTLRILAGLAHATSGSAAVAGVPLDGAITEITRRIGYLDQDPRYYGWMTGRELVETVGRLHHLRGYVIEQRATEVLRQVGLSDAAHRRIGTYSGGMRQRLGIAQALVNDPALLILDEPVSSLDPEGRRDLLTLIADLRATSTVLFSTHVLADVERVCDRVAIIDHGRLVTEGPLDALLDRYALPVYRLDPEPGQDERVKRLVEALRSAPWTTDVNDEHGMLRVTVVDPARAAGELLPAVVATGVTLVAFERVRPTLEDVFLQLVGRDANGGRPGAGEAA